MTRMHLRHGAQPRGQFELEVTPASAGWGHTGLRVVELPAGGSVEVDTGETEMLVLSLRGGCTVGCAAESYEIRGRASVFTGVSDFVYVPRDSTAEIASERGGRFALPFTVCRRTLPFRYGPAAEVPVELRGAGQASRQVNNFCTPEAFDADTMIACEVLTPGGNWSSYPPHKHDEAAADESELEEIYYFQVADGPAGPGIGYQRVYGHDDRQIDVLAEVGSGDTILVPYGWHGPSMAAPGYDLYYLNVMAGPGDERRWAIRDDPAHVWVRDTWPSQPVDPRLPMYGGPE